MNKSMSSVAPNWKECSVQKLTGTQPRITPITVAVARRLQGHVRATDLVARLGGDEFVVVASALESPAQAHDLANKLLDAFHAPFTLSATKVQVGLTIGYALAPLDAYDAASLLKLADAAMYQGKQNGKFRVQRSTEQLAMP